MKIYFQDEIILQFTEYSAWKRALRAFLAAKANFGPKMCTIEFTNLCGDNMAFANLFSGCTDIIYEYPETETKKYVKNIKSKARLVTYKALKMAIVLTHFKRSQAITLVLKVS